MSVEAITWALKQDIKPSGTKFVLVAIANCADGKDGIAWPSVAYLAEATGQDRKTVMAGIARLMETGYIRDTGERRGLTKQVIVYQLPDFETFFPKQSQKRDSTENGTVPKFPSNSTGTPQKQYRNSAETVPKTGHGTVNEPSLEPSVKHTPPAQAQSGASSRGSASKPASGYPKDFELAWAGYPDRPGANKKAAFKAWSARIKAGVDPNDILAGVQRYAKYCDATKTTGTRYVKQPETFFGPDEHYEQKWETPAPAGSTGKTGVRHGNFGSQDYHAGLGPDGAF